MRAMIDFSYNQENFQVENFKSKHDNKANFNSRLKKYQARVRKRKKRDTKLSDFQENVNKFQLTSSVANNHLVNQYLHSTSNFPPFGALASSNSLIFQSNPFLNGTSIYHSLFSLTPEARACITATYLCVLFVNNTWLDCNLPEALCNSNRSYSIVEQSKEDYESSKLSLRELQFSLDSLIALSSLKETELDNERNNRKPLEVNYNGTVVVATPRNLSNSYANPVFTSEQVQINRLTEPPDDTESTLTESPLMYISATQTSGPIQSPINEDEKDVRDQEEDERFLQLQVNEMAKLGRLVDEDKRKLIDYLRKRKKEALKKKSSTTQKGQQNFRNFSRNYLKTDNLEPEVSSSSTTITELSSTTPSSPPPASSPSTSSSYLGNWMVRPLQLVKGWAPQSLWIWPYSVPDQSVDRSPSSVYIGGQVQLLRPVDRLDIYNDIQAHKNLTDSNVPDMQRQVNQLTFNHNQAIDVNSNSQEPGEKNLVSSSLGNLLTSAIPFTENSQTMSTNQPFTSQTSNGESEDYLGPPDHNIVVVNNSNEQLMNPSSSQRYINQKKQENNNHNKRIYSHSRNNQQILSHQEDIDCKCNDNLQSNLQFDNEQNLNNSICRFRCTLTTSSTYLPNSYLLSQQTDNKHQLISSATFGQSTSVLPGLAAVTTSNPIGASSTTAAKMNPLDISFWLYTRYHRSLAIEMSQIREAIGNFQTSSSTTPLSPSSESGDTFPKTTNAITQKNNLNLASNFINYGELIEINTNDSTLSSELEHFNSSLPIKIIIHGFGSGGKRVWVSEMVSKLLDYEEVNVIVVDWEKGATLPNYVQAAGNTRLVGHKIASLIKSLNKEFGLTGNSYHLIGFSLGAHVAGFAGMELRVYGSQTGETNVSSLNSQLINRITGLDPASPLFEGYEASERLDLTDAKFVDVVHSNGDGVLRGGFGSLQPMGHVDFYPNGGRVQVGCNSVLLSALSDIIYGKWQSLCNHRRALNFFMDSFEFDKCRFRSFNCDSYESYLRGECFDCGTNNEKCSYMGYLANYSKGRGKMYLTTHEEAPFCANQFIIKIIGSKGLRQNQWGKVEVTLVTVDGKNESFWLSAINQQTTHHHELAYPLTNQLSVSTNGAGNNLSGQQQSLSNSNNPTIQTNNNAIKGEPLIVSQHSMQSLIVARSSLMNLTQVLLRYTKYKGWIYSGDENWSIDKVFITDGDGQVKSFCGFNTILESHIISRLNLEPGNCTVVGEAVVSGKKSIVVGLTTSDLEQSLARQQSEPPRQHAPSRTGRLFKTLPSSGETQTSASKLQLSAGRIKSIQTQQVQNDQQQVTRQQQQQQQLSMPFAFNSNPLIAISQF